jgi:hypothetical protein
MKLSEHLSLSEVIRSESAKRNGISNMPTPEHIENFKILATKVFEPIREHFGVPIRISSGYRSKELNVYCKIVVTLKNNLLDNQIVTKYFKNIFFILLIIKITFLYLNKQFNKGLLKLANHVN